MPPPTLNYEEPVYGVLGEFFRARAQMGVLGE